MNEIRNELLLIVSLMKSKNDDEKKFQLSCLLERFEYDVKDQLKDIEYKKKELESNLRIIEYVRKELGVK